MKRFFIFGFCLLIGFLVRAQQYKFEKIDVQSTIVSSTVYDLLQDKKGFIWIASIEGLGRYDGHNVLEFKHYKNVKESICSNQINSICEAIDGRIWIGTKGGLSVYNPSTEQIKCHYNFENDNSRGDNIILSVLADRNGFIWYSTYNGLFRYDPETEERKLFQPDDTPHSLSNKLIFSIFEDRDGMLWFATRNGISYYRNDGSFHFDNIIYDPSELLGLKHERYFTFCQTSNGDIWLGGDSGFYKVIKFNGELQFSHYKHDPANQNSLSYNYVNHLLADGTDLWVSTWAGGLNKVKFEEEGQEPSFTHYRSDKNNPQSIISDEINVTLLDNNGVMWVGTGFGLMKSSPYSSKIGLITAMPNVPYTLTNNKVQASLVDSEGNLWVGSENGLSFRPKEYSNEETQFINFQHEKGNKSSLTHNNIFDIYEDSSKRIWIATYDGFSIANLNSFKRTQKFSRLKFNKYPHKWIYNILETTKDHFWISTYGKLAKMHYPTTSQTPYFDIFDMDAQNPNALSNATTYQTCKDSKDRVWVGTYFGLSRIDENDDCVNFINFYKNREEKGSLSDDSIVCLYLDKSGRFWIGTRNGLNLLIEDKNGNSTFMTFDESTGFPNSVINFIEEDFQGLLWIGTGNGLVHFNPMKAEKGENSIINIYTHHDGLGKNFTVARSSCQDKEGIIYFGTEGLNYFDPNNLVFNQNVPDLSFTKLKVLNEDVMPDINGILESSITSAEAVVDLKYDDNTIEIFFSCLDYSNSQKNRYMYKLEGVNTEWVDSGNHNSATYTNLSTGAYNFQVKGCNNDGVWNNTPISLTLNVRPHWSASRLAYFIYLALCLLLGSLFYRWRILRAKEKVKIIKDIEIARFEERERLRKKNAADFHDELGHRLTKIALFLEIAKKHVGNNIELVEYLEKVKTNTRSLSEGLKDLIWSLDPKKDTLMDTINRIQEVGDNIFDYSEMQFSTEAIDERHESIKLSPSRRKQMLLIFKEAMNNTLKYSKADQCVFRSEIIEDRIYFIFKDNGVGFNLKNIKKGNGLTNMKDRADKIGGDLLFESSLNSGVKISLSIPFL